MAFIPAENVMLITLSGTLYGGKIQNTLYFKKSNGSSFSQADFDLLADTVELWYFNNLVNSVSNQAGFNVITGYDLTSDSSPVYSQLATLVGNVPSSAAPASVAFSISFKTGNRGRSGRGRNYVPGVPESVITGNSVSSAYYNAVRDGYEALIALVAAQGFVWGVLSRYTNGAPRVQGLFQPITNVTFANSQVDSQRKRVVQT